MLSKILKTVSNFLPINITIIKDSINSNIRVWNGGSESPNLIPTDLPILKTELTNELKKKFIGDFLQVENYISRTYRNDNKSSKEKQLYGWTLNQELELLPLVERYKKVVIIGNPGLGKTIELHTYAKSLWTNTKYTDIPIFCNLRDFTSQHSIEKFLPNGWDLVRDVVFILDGLDEIQNVQDFISKLNVFTRNLETNKTKFKILLSCRSNVFEIVIQNMDGFKVINLNDINYTDAIKYLKVTCQDSFTDVSLTSEQNVFLKNPFTLKILSAYIIANNKAPSNIVELWANYVELRLQEDNRVKFIRLLNGLNIQFLRNRSQKISIINELQNLSFITEKSLFRILEKIDYEEFIRNPLICNEGDNWTFEHRQIQEYFVASSLIDLSFSKLLEIIKVEGVEFIHPSMHNSVTFLLNLLKSDSPSFHKLSAWLQKNQIDVLLKSDTDRISKQLRVEIFQNYFITECVEKQLWIRTRHNVDYSDLVRIGDDVENFKFLISYLDYEKYHFRVVISAIRLLAERKLSSANKLTLLQRFKDILANTDVEVGIKTNVLEAIFSLNFIIDNPELLLQIIDFNKEETNRSYNHQILYLIDQEGDSDKYIDFITHEFKLDNEPRKPGEATIIGNSALILKVILKLNVVENFLPFISFYLNPYKRTYADNEDISKIISRCITFYNNESKFIITLLDIVYDQHGFYGQEGIIQEIIKQTGSNEIVIQYLLEKSNFSNNLFYIGEIISEESLSLVIRYLKTNKINHDFIEKFRNVIYNKGKIDLALIFQQKMVSDGIKFSTLYSIHTKEEESKRSLEIAKSNFELLFNTDKLESEIEMIFFPEGIKTIDSTSIRKTQIKWYEVNGHFSHNESNAIRLVVNIYYHIFNSPPQLSFDEILRALKEDETILLRLILSNVKNDYNHPSPEQLTAKQLEYITNWCVLQPDLIDFNKVIVTKGGQSFLGEDYYKLTLVLAFQEELGFELPESFYLNSLAFFETEKVISTEDNYDMYKLLVKNDSAFNQQIVNNIKSNNLNGAIFQKHIIYAIENKLDDVFDEIKLFFEQDNSLSHDSKRLHQFYLFDNDVSLLVDYCKDSKEQICWTSMEVFHMINKEKDLCIEIALKYLNSSEETNNSKALYTLLKWNYKEAIEELFKLIDNKQNFRLGNLFYYQYDAKIAAHTFKKLYYFILELEEDEEILNMDKHSAKSFIERYVTNQSNSEANYTQMKMELEEIQVELVNDDKDLFNVNLLLSNAEKSYVNHMSKPFSLKGAIKKAEEILG